MKSTVIIYTALVLVGTATGISIQQPSMASKGMESTNPIESRTSKKLQQIGSDKCEDAGIFDNVAYEIEYSGNCNLPWQYNQPNQLYIDIDGDEKKDSIIGGCFWLNGGFDQDELILLYPETKNGSPSFGLKPLLNLNPDYMYYEGLNNPQDFDFTFIGFTDITTDGLLDAVVRGSDYPTNLYFVIQNISPAPGVACSSDLNGNGSVEVNDLMQVVSDWGACP